MIIILLVSMLFAHIVVDIIFQKLIYDAEELNLLTYFILYCSAAWSFMINLPLAILVYDKIGITYPFLYFYIVSLLVNMVIYMIMGYVKIFTVKSTILAEQIVHVLQILGTLVVFCLINGHRWI